MVPGPVFTFELMTTARRGRFYTARAFYGIVLLVILWAIHSIWSGAYKGELPSRMVNWFALSAFIGITVGQELLVLTLTPALVAGVIADEKRRKTLHYLMASQLTSAEIVLGKLLVRMLYVGVLLGVSLPVLSLLVLMGGIDPRLVVLGSGATLSTAWFLAALSIWVSTIAGRPREALFIAFGLEGLWLSLPWSLRDLVAMTTGWPSIDRAAGWVADWVGASSPVDVYWQMFYGFQFGGRLVLDLESISWMIGLQLGIGAVLAALAAVQLRPIFRRQDRESRPRRGLRAMLASRRSWRLRARPALDDRPTLWKELHTGGARGFARLIGWFLTLTAGGFLAYYAVWFGAMAYLEFLQYGYASSVYYALAQDRWRFYWFLVIVMPFIYLAGILTVAGAAAASITSEHEEDTWVSLTTTDLTGREIIFAKLLGSLWRARRLASVIGLLTVAGIVVESLHVLSLPALVIALAVFGWFAAALGVWVSLQLRSTWRAQFLTIASLLLVNVAGQGIINTLSPRGFAPQVWPGFTPYELSKLVMDHPFFDRLSTTTWPRFWRLWDVDGGPGWLAIFSMMSVVGYAILAALLTWDSLRRFELVAGRARQSRRPQPADPMDGVQASVIDL